MKTCSGGKTAWKQYVETQKNDILEDYLTLIANNIDFVNDGFDEWISWYPNAQTTHLREDHPDYYSPPYIETDINVYLGDNGGIRITAYYIDCRGQTDTNTFIQLL